MTNETDRTLRLKDLYAGRDIDAMPGNRYEIAPGVIAEMKPPVVALQEEFEELDEPMQALYRKINNELKAKDLDVVDEESYGAALAQVESVTANEYNRVQQDVSLKQSRIVLDLPEKVERGQMFGPMAARVRAHFFVLVNPTGPVQSES